MLIHPDDGSVESWTEEGSGDKMRADFADFEPSCVTIRGIEAVGVSNGTTIVASRSFCHLSSQR